MVAEAAMRRIEPLLLPVVLALVGYAPAPAAAQCAGNFTMANCDQNSDLVVDELEAVSIIDPCTSYGDSATAILDLVVRNTTSNRQDVGIFVATNGGSALTGGSCYRDFLPPPITTSPVYGDSNGDTIPDIRNGPWVDNEPSANPHDSCGDIGGGTQAIKSLQTAASPLTISCSDTDGDGHVDADVCLSWSNGTINACQDLNDARPSGNQTCWCMRVRVLPEPGAALSVACGAALLAVLARGRTRAA
jgi:hypothetical protein